MGKGKRNRKKAQSQLQVASINKNQQQPSPEILQKMDEEEAARQQLVSYNYSGPLPPASQLAQYEQVLSGAADRIITMAEDQGAHRRSKEDSVISANIASEKTGQIMGFIIAVLGLVGGGFLIFMGREVAGTIIASADLIALAGIFVYGRHHQNKS